MEESKALVMLSGGLDSATCLYWAKKNYSDVSAITFNYYDRLENEKKATSEIAKRANLSSFLSIDIPFIKESSDFYSNKPNILASDGRWRGYVPARNLIFYSIAAHYSEFLQIKWIIAGHNSHDGAFFKDATKDYIHKVNSLFQQQCLLCNDTAYIIVLPLGEMDRVSIINLAFELEVPLELTWSCHDKGTKHCGRCYACLQRIEAFSSLGIRDPVFSSDP
jgi:7-cyano-7-deazaguanine synthase